MIKLLKKYRSAILYVIFGGFTTLINIIVYYFSSYVGGFDTVSSNIIAWILSVLFAYITNRKWVFESQNDTKKGVMKEISSFFGCRLATGVLDVLIMFISVDILNLNGMLMKCFSNILVIIINYIASKFMIFK